MSTGDCSISAGTPRKLHHRIAMRSFCRCASMSFGVTFALSDACGMLLLSDLNSQNPEMSGFGFVSCAAAEVTKVKTNPMKSTAFIAAQSPPCEEGRLRHQENFGEAHLRRRRRGGRLRATERVSDHPVRSNKGCFATIS